MSDPFKHITGPACINFSGGRTSGYMLWRTLQAHDGKLPEDVHAIFCNTGKERPETLDFVQRCSEEWNVPVTWLEFDPEAEHRTKIVNHNSAARNGEPFDAAVEERQYLPNPVTRFCTIELKIRRSYKFMFKMMGYEHWVAHLGLRADEPRRVAKIGKAKERWINEAPLARAGITKRDIGEFWAAQPFDLNLPNINNNTPHGNCDLCFLKSRPTIQALIHEDPGSAKWWIEKEALALALASKPSGAVFRSDRPSYAAMLDQVQRQSNFDFGDESSIDCFCTD